MENSIVRHILLGKFRPEMTAAQFDEIIKRFREMAEKIPGTFSFEHGANNSSEGRDLGMTQVVAECRIRSKEIVIGNKSIPIAVNRSFDE